MRFGGYAIYDVRLAFLPRWRWQEAMLLEAVRRIPLVFGESTRWGWSRPDGSVWVDEAEHDIALRRIRLRLRCDPAALTALDGRARSHLGHLANLVEHASQPLTSASMAAIVDAAATATAWVACNWLNPVQHLRIAALRLGMKDIDACVADVLAGGHQALLLQAHRGLHDVISGRLTAQAFTHRWGPIFAMDPAQPAPRDEAAVAGLARAAAERNLAGGDLARAVPGRTADVAAKLLERSAERDGPEATSLLAAQLQFSRTTVWAEERRREVLLHVDRLIDCEFDNYGFSELTRQLEADSELPLSEPADTRKRGRSR